MQGYPNDYKVNIYGDGSYTSPTVWWAALGGFGVWMPEWISPNQATCIEPPGTESSSSRSSHGGEGVFGSVKKG